MQFGPRGVLYSSADEADGDDVDLRSVSSGRRVGD